VSRRVLVLNGPNLNLLGRRDPEVYGTATLEALCVAEGDRLGLHVECRQSNHEGVLIDWIHEAFEAGTAIVGNFGAYTHTSIALMDALAVVTAPVVEVHISDIHAREEFRHRSYVGMVADAAVIGRGVEGYAEALREVARLWPA
jgi:3-dehydroquinate dehydratase II